MKKNSLKEFSDRLKKCAKEYNAITKLQKERDERYKKLKKEVDRLDKMSGYIAAIESK
jgi:hypothetical protein